MARRSESSQRLRVLAQYPLLDTSQDVKFDAIVQLAARICETPYAAFSIVGRDREWLRGSVGFEVRELPIQQSLCALVLDATDLVEIPDLRIDPRTFDNPMVAGPLRLRSFAGAPVRVMEGATAGFLAVYDVETRRLDDNQRATLRTMADQVVTLLDLQRLLVETSKENDDAERRSRLFAVGAPTDEVDALDPPTLPRGDFDRGRRR